MILPSLRYLVHLNGPGWNVIGSGEPALPGVAIGHNERIGWGFTIVQYDAADLFVERTNPENSNQYLLQGDWLDMRIEHEELRVQGQDQPERVELKFTHNGPVIWEDPDNERVVALRWAGQEPGTPATWVAWLSIRSKTGTGSSKRCGRGRFRRRTSSTPM